MSVGQGRANQVQKVRTTCAYCGVGCNFDLHVRDGRVVRVTSARKRRVNGLALCVKGRYGYDYVHHRDRLKAPLRARAAGWMGWQRRSRAVPGRYSPALEAAAGRRRRQRTLGSPSFTPDSLIQTDWDTALDVVARKFAAEKRAHGGQTFAVLTSAKCTNEENYLVSKLARQVLGTNTMTTARGFDIAPPSPVW